MRHGLRFSALLVFACSAPMALQATRAALSPPSEPRGLAIDIEDGAGVPLTVRAGQTFWVNQIDLRAAITATVDEGVSGPAAPAGRPTELLRCHFRPQRR